MTDDVCVCARGEEESLTDVEGDPNFVTAFRPDFRCGFGREKFERVCCATRKPVWVPVRKDC